MEPTVAPTLSLEIQSEEELRLHAWRAEQLRRLGVQGTVAENAAVLVSFDWHEVADLVERGCAPELALEIVR
jgi:hypothetical protein